MLHVQRAEWSRTFAIQDERATLLYENKQKIKKIKNTAKFPGPKLRHDMLRKYWNFASGQENSTLKSGPPCTHVLVFHVLVFRLYWKLLNGHTQYMYVFTHDYWASPSSLFEYTCSRILRLSSMKVEPSQDSAACNDPTSTLETSFKFIWNHNVLSMQLHVPVSNDYL